MKYEMIDRLDDNGNTIGTVLKSVAHRDGLWHRAVHVWIVNNDEILLQYRCAKKDFYPNVWDTSFAGHVDAGETPLDAVIREGKEELGIDVDISKLTHLFTIKEQLTYKDIISNEFVDVFLLRDNIKLEDIVLQDSEVGDVKYMKIDEFFNRIENNDESIMAHKEIHNKLKVLIR